MEAENSTGFDGEKHFDGDSLLVGLVVEQLVDHEIDAVQYQNS